MNSSLKNKIPGVFKSDRWEVTTFENQRIFKPISNKKQEDENVVFYPPDSMPNPQKKLLDFDSDTKNNANSEYRETMESNQLQNKLSKNNIFDSQKLQDSVNNIASKKDIFLENNDDLDLNEIYSVESLNEPVPDYQANPNNLQFSARRVYLKKYSNGKQKEKMKNIKAMANNIKYCGPSPDEISLLSGCKDFCGFFFIGADSSKVVIQTQNIKFEVEKLICNEFESDRKMMSVLIKYNGKGTILLYTQYISI